MSQRYFVRTTRKRLTYRDEKGRFMSKEKAIKEGIAPIESTVVSFQDQNGKFASKEKVKRAKRKIIDKVEGEGVIKPEDVPNKAEFISVLGQQVRKMILDSSLQGDDIAFLWKGRLYKVRPEERFRLQEAWMQLSWLAVDLFKRQGTLYYTIDVAERPGKLVLDFDSIAPTDAELSTEEEAENARIFNAQANDILKGLY